MFEMYFLVLSWFMMVPFVWSIYNVYYYIRAKKEIQEKGLEQLFKLTLYDSTKFMFVVGFLSFVYLIAYYWY